MDVVTVVEGLRVMLQAETGFTRRSQAIKDADARLCQKLVTGAFAVCYLSDGTEDNLAEAGATWSNGNVAGLAQAVQQAPRSLDNADVAARMLSDGLDTVVQRLKPFRPPRVGPGIGLVPRQEAVAGKPLFRSRQARDAGRCQMMRVVTTRIIVSRAGRPEPP